MLTKKIITLMDRSGATEALSKAVMTARAAGNSAILQPLGLQEPPRRQSMQEEMLTLKVRRRLLGQVKSAALPVKVDANGSTITLTGQVNDSAIIKHAQFVARSVPGVHQVCNNLTIAPVEPYVGGGVKAALAASGPLFKDAVLEARIKSKLIVNTGAPAFAIEIESIDGVVSLSGNSPDQAHRDRTLDITRATRGVKAVNDQLKIMATGDAIQ